MDRRSAFAPVGRLIDDAVRRRAFPCAAVEVGGGAGPIWSHAAGNLSYDAEAEPATADTVFDLASLTKVLATTTVLMRLVDAGAVSLADRVGSRLGEWRGGNRDAATVADLLEHAGGLTAHLPFFRDHRGRRDYQHAICTLPLEYPPRTRSVYSDLGFILLAFIAADAAGGGLDEQLDAVRHALSLGINYFDTARAYGEGQSEANLGRVLDEIGKEIVLSTKVRLESDALGDIASATVAHADQGLARLRRDSVDLMQLHTRLVNRRESGRFGMTPAEVLGPMITL